MSVKKKVVWLPYDMDTAIGINNDGQLVFGYQLEDTDYQQGGAPIFNGQASVIWNNIRKAFPEELATMYRNLRSSGALSYDKIEKAFEEHQSKWSEAIFNEDAYFKYIEPFVNGSANYLYMLLGSKEEQRKWWLYNRFRYIDSKYVAGDARNDSIFLRPYAAANITVTPYADIYATVAWDATITQERAERNKAVTLVCPYSEMNGNIVNIYSSSQLADVGDLAPLKIGQIDISSATRLQSLKVGDSASLYDNSNLYSLTFGANVLLQTVDVRNCSGLGDTTMQGHTQTTVDLSGCSIIENVYLEGTKIQGVMLPNGGVLKTLHLPSTVKNLTVQNQPALTDFSVQGGSYAGITTLWLENAGVLDGMARTLLNSIAEGSNVRLINIHWECADTTEIETVLARLDKMGGIDDTGLPVRTAQVSGEIHTGTLTGAQIAAYKARYSYIDFTADHTSSVIYFYNGSTLITQQTVLDGGDATYTGTTPTKTQDAQYTYSFSGWSREDDNTVDADALQKVTVDRNVYACYTGTLRKYSVYYVRSTNDGGGTLQTINNVDYGTVIAASSRYTGSTPTTTQGDATDYPFVGWEPARATVTGNTTFTAKFRSPIDVSEISDDWDTIIANIDNGTYSTVYKVGQYKPLDLGTEGTINMQIVAMDADELADGSGYAPLTFVGMELLTTARAMNSVNSATLRFEDTKLYETLNSTIYDLIPSGVSRRIQRVSKVSSLRYGNEYTSQLKLWIPSRRELGFSGSSSEETGVLYNKIYTDDNSRIKRNRLNAVRYWTRTHVTGNNSDYWFAVLHTGAAYDYGYSASTKNSIALGFCLGLEPET